MKKKRIILFLFVSVFLCFSTVYAAAYYTTYSNWTSADGSYAPYTGSVRTDSYSRSGADDVSVRVYNIKYSNSAIDKIRSQYTLMTLYPTMDVTDMSNCLTYDGWYSSNYPNPKFDKDDDNGNGSYEETEVVCRSPLSMVAGTNYWYDVGFTEYSGYANSYSGTLNITAQQSAWHVIEYNTIYYDTLDTINYKTPAN